MSLPKEGTHIGKLSGAPVVADAKTGAVLFVVPCELTDENASWRGKHQMVLIQKDGTVNQNTIKTLRTVFAVDGSLESILALQDRDCVGMEVEFSDCKHEVYTPEGSAEEVMQFRTGWMNPVGGSSVMPDPVDRQALLNKFRSKFAALSGGKPAAKSAAKVTETKTEPKTAPKSPPGKRTSTAATAPTATMDETIEAFTKMGGKDEDWFAAMREFAGQDDDNEKLTIQQLGLMKQKFEQAAQK